MDQQPPLKKRKTSEEDAFPFWDLEPELQKLILSYVLEDPQRFQRALNNLRLSLVCKSFLQLFCYREDTTDVWIHGKPSEDHAHGERCLFCFESKRMKHKYVPSTDNWMCCNCVKLHLRRKRNLWCHSSGAHAEGNCSCSFRGCDICWDRRRIDGFKNFSMDTFGEKF